MFKLILNPENDDKKKVLNKLKLNIQSLTKFDFDHDLIRKLTLILYYKRNYWLSVIQPIWHTKTATYLYGAHCILMILACCISKISERQNFLSETNQLISISTLDEKEKQMTALMKKNTKFRTKGLFDL